MTDLGRMAGSFARIRTITLSVAALALGTGTAAWAGASLRPKPEVTDVEKYCSTEQQGAYQLAEDLHRRERELDSREHAVAAQEAEMATAEGRLKSRLEELEKTRKELQDLLGQADTRRDERIAGIVKMVESGRASAMAPMFGQLSDELAVAVLDKMNRSKAGKLLAALPPARAAALAQKMAEPIAVAVP